MFVVDFILEKSRINTAPLSEPVDISWKDLASGKIKPFNPDGYFFYVQCGGVTMEYLKRHPATYEEWAVLCDVSDIATETDGQ